VWSLCRSLRPDDEVFLCEATKEVFRDYDEFFQRTILCNSLVWSCAITGKTNLTYEEAVESEKKARKRLGAIPKALKRSLVLLASKTRRGRLADMVDDVYVYAYNRFFIGETVEAVIKDQWCDCKVLRAIPPTDEEVAKDAKEEAEELAKEGGEAVKKAKEKKTFLPPDHLFRYEVEEIEPDNPDVKEVHTLEAEDIRREKGLYTREKNLLFLKNAVELGKDANFVVKREIRDRHHLDTLKFTDIFAGPEPVFEESKRLKGFGGEKKSSNLSAGNKKTGKGQATLDNWMKGQGSKSGGRKLTPAEIAAEQKKRQEQNARFKEELKRRQEEAKQRRLEDKAKEKERKKEEKRLLGQLMSEWNKPRDDLECDDLAELPRPHTVHCKVPNKLFGDVLVLLEFCQNFSELLEVDNSFPTGITFDLLHDALTDSTSIGGSLYDVLSFFLLANFDLQDEEDEEVKVDKLTADADNLDKNVIGKDEDIANQVHLQSCDAIPPFFSCS
jgi:bromodomain adjacent to zinc finger domain protein 1A